jgi:hypothetical protein
MKVLVTIADSDYEMLKEVLDDAAANMDIEQPFDVEVLKYESPTARDLRQNPESTEDSDDTQVSRVAQDSSESVSQQPEWQAGRIKEWQAGRIKELEDGLKAIIHKPPAVWANLTAHTVMAMSPHTLINHVVSLVGEPSIG